MSSICFQVRKIKKPWSPNIFTYILALSKENPTYEISTVHFATGQPNSRLQAVVNSLWPDVVVTLHMKLCKSQVSRTVFLTPMNSKSLLLAGNRSFLKDIYFSISRLLRRLFPSLRLGLAIWFRSLYVDQPDYVDQSAWPGMHPDPPSSSSQSSVTKAVHHHAQFLPKAIKVLTSCYGFICASPHCACIC